MTPSCRSVAPLVLAVCTAVTAACASREAPPERPVPPAVAPTDAPPAPAPAPELPPRPELPPVVTAPAPATPVACPLVPDPGLPIATVALADPVDPTRAPRPGNASERLLFRQLYETLVGVDCEGRVVPALAGAWRAGEDGRAWIVSLREQARFADGTFVTAGAVLASWSLPDGGGLQEAVRRLIVDVTVLDGRRLAVVPRGPAGEAPLVLAHTDLAVASSRADSAWPLGTRSVRAVIEPPLASVPGSQMVVVRDARGMANQPGAIPDVRFLLAPRRDGRDLLDQGVDLLVTRDPATLDYAAALLRFRRVLLPWRRTHVLLAPGRRPGMAPPTFESRQALADDAVRGEARGAEGPFWWEEPGCATGRPIGTRLRAPSSRRIVYDETDGVARDLAERLVGLARAAGSSSGAVLDGLPLGQPEPVRAVGLGGEVLAAAIRGGADAGYVLPLERRPLDRCAALEGLAAAAPWLLPETVVPLVDTRLQAIVGRDRSGATVEWDGTLVLVGDAIER